MQIPAVPSQPIPRSVSFCPQKRQHPGLCVRARGVRCGSTASFAGRPVNSERGNDSHVSATFGRTKPVPGGNDDRAVQTWNITGKEVFGHLRHFHDAVVVVERKHCTRTVITEAQARTSGTHHGEAKHLSVKEEEHCHMIVTCGLQPLLLRTLAIARLKDEPPAATIATSFLWCTHVESKRTAQAVRHPDSTVFRIFYRRRLERNGNTRVCSGHAAS